MADLVLTVIADDRPGLVQAVSAPVETAGGSWQRSELTRLGGKFAGVALVSVPDAAVEQLRADLVALADDGLQVQVEAASAPAGREDGLSTGGLHLVGDDRPGIVAEISTVLARHGVGIDSLETDVHEAPMVGGMLFEADAVLTLPAACDLDALQASLEEVAGELMVDLALTAPAPSGTDTTGGVSPGVPTT